MIIEKPLLWTFAWDIIPNFDRDEAHILQRDTASRKKFIFSHGGRLERLYQDIVPFSNRDAA